MRKLIVLIIIISCNDSNEFFENAYCIENINIIDSKQGLKENMTIIISENK